MTDEFDKLLAEFPPSEADRAWARAVVADEMERIAHEPPINGNMLAQARLLLRVQQIRAGAASPHPQR